MISDIKNKISGITSFTTYENSEMETCKLNAYHLIMTKYGELVPQYKEFGIRTKDSDALGFYENGTLKSISLEAQTNITTPIGIFPAERVTFFEDGSLNTLFPLNGKISFSWSEEEEEGLAQSFDFDFPFGRFTVKIIGLRFYQTGVLRSLILWPHQVINLHTSIGQIPVRIGFELFENGILKSLEPAEPTWINTPIGLVRAFDSNAVGVDADKNSLEFDEKGNVISVTTSGAIMIDQEMISSRLRIGLMDDELVKMPIKIAFRQEEVIIDDGIKQCQYVINQHVFKILYDESLGKKACFGDCSGCSECS
jgi:hypothetical protein